MGATCPLQRPEASTVSAFDFYEWQPGEARRFEGKTAKFFAEISERTQTYSGDWKYSGSIQSIASG